MLGGFERQRKHLAHGGMQTRNIGEAGVHRIVDDDTGPARGDVGDGGQGLHLVAHGGDLDQQNAARRRWQAVFTPTQGQ